MGKTWFQKLFSSAPGPELESAVVPADRGNAEVQFGLGLKCANPLGTPPDYLQAAEWYLKAAEQNHGLAQFNLGVMYARGQGVTQSDSQSAVWIGRAARQGDAGAQYMMGMNHVRDTFSGLPNDILESKIEGYKWLQLAAAQGYDKSNAACDSLTMSMSRDAVTEAMRRVTGFRATSRVLPEPLAKAMPIDN